MNEHYDRVRQMILDDGNTWDLSPNDKKALKYVLGLVNLLADEVAAYSGQPIPTVLDLYGTKVLQAQKAKSEKEDDPDRMFLTKEQAISMLPDGDTIHTFRSVKTLLIGCDFSRDEMLKIINANTCEIGGEACKKMNHGLVVYCSGSLFVECKKDFDYVEFESKISDL